MGFKQSPFPMIEGTEGHKKKTEEAGPLKMPALIGVAVGALKEDTAALERANNRKISAASIQRK